jgi:hypothetical protein
MIGSPGRDGGDSCSRAAASVLMASAHPFAPPERSLRTDDPTAAWRSTQAPRVPDYADRGRASRQVAFRVDDATGRSIPRQPVTDQVGRLRALVTGTAGSLRVARTRQGWRARRFPGWPGRGRRSPRAAGGPSRARARQRSSSISSAASSSRSGRPSRGRAAVRTTRGSMIFFTVRVSGSPSAEDRTATPGIRCHARARTTERGCGFAVTLPCSIAP